MARIGTWGGFLVITGYCIGHLYDKKEQALQDIKKTYSGIMEMLSLIIDSVDQKTTKSLQQGINNCCHDSARNETPRSRN